MRTEAELLDELRALQSEAAGQPFTAEQRERWNELNAAIDEIRVRRERLHELSRDSRHMEGEPSEPTSAIRRQATRRATPTHMQSTRDAALATIDAHTDVLDARAADRLEAVVERDVAGPEAGAGSRYLKAVGDPHYCSAFGKMLAEPQSAHLRWTPEEHRAVQEVNKIVDEQRSLGIGSQGGNYPVPFTLDPTVILTSNGVINPLREISRVETIAGNTWYGVASDGLSAGYGAEFTEASDNSPTLTQPSVTVEKAQAFVPFSIEVGEDWTSLQAELAGMFQDAKDTLEATKFLSGAGHGSNEPQGLLVGATAVVQTAATATLATGDFYSLVQALAPRWQPRARLVAAPQTWDTAYRLVGGNSTEPPVLPTREGPLLGRPKYELSPMTAAASTAPTTGGSIVTVGDFRQFLIVDRIGMSVELIPHLFATANNRPMGARGLYAYWRNSSQVLTPLAFRTLKVK